MTDSDSRPNAVEPDPMRPGPRGMSPVCPNIAWGAVGSGFLQRDLDLAVQILERQEDLSRWIREYHVLLGFSSSIHFLPSVERASSGRVRLRDGVVTYHRTVPIQPLMAQEPRERVAAFYGLLAEMLSAIAKRMGIPEPPIHGSPELGE